MRIFVNRSEIFGSWRQRTIVGFKSVPQIGTLKTKEVARPKSIDYIIRVQILEGAENWVILAEK